MSSAGAAALTAGAGIFGLLIGSFLNVVVWRLPRGESIVSPASHCPACDAALRARDNVPVVSWLVLRGRCRDCGSPISARYPFVELLTALVFALLALRIGPHADLPAFLYLGGAGVALALIDVDVKRLPDALTLPSYPVGILLLGAAVLAGTDDAARLLRALLGMAALFAFFFLLALVYPAGMGWGDVKLAGVLGLYLGWLGWGVLIAGGFLGFLLGGSLGVVLLATRRGTRKSAIPFGPFMLAGALGAVLWGQFLVDSYLGAVVS